MQLRTAYTQRASRSKHYATINASERFTVEAAQAAISQLSVMFILILVGFFLRKLNYVTHEATLPFNSLLIHVALPCLIIASVSKVHLEDGASQLVPTFVLAFAEFLLLFIVAILINAVLKTPLTQRNLYVFMSLCTNTGFVVLPVLQAVYGDQTVMLSSIFVLMCNLFMGSLGIAALESAQKGQHKLTGFRITWKTLWNAPLVACVFAIVWLFSGLTMPDVAQSTLSLMGGICTPVAMVIVGIVLADSDLKAIFTDWRMYAYVVIRQLAIPALLAVVLAPFVADKLILATTIIMFAAPAGAMVQAFAQRYDQDINLAASGTVITTLACIPIFPALIALLSVL